MCLFSKPSHSREEVGYWGLTSRLHFSWITNIRRIGTCFTWSHLIPENRSISYYHSSTRTAKCRCFRWTVAATFRRGCNLSGQLLDDVLRKIRADSVDPNIQARFSVNEQMCGDQPLSPRSIEDKIVKTLVVNEILPQLISHGVVSMQENEIIRSVSFIAEIR